MPNDTKIRVLIADDFAMLRRVILLVLEQAVDIEVVGEAPDLRDARHDVQTLQPDVILMNDYLPPTNSALATKLFRESGITAAILIISMETEVEMIEQSFANGANGFMHKGEMGLLLAEAVRKVYHGERYLSPKAEKALNEAKDS